MSCLLVDIRNPMKIILSRNFDYKLYDEGCETFIKEIIKDMNEFEARLKK